MTDKKFVLTSEKKEFMGKTLFRIKAIRAFGIVKKDELGGFVEKEANLDHAGNAWVYGDALVYGNARVCEDARVYGNARVCEDARVYGNAWVYGDALVYGNARVYGDAWVSGKIRLAVGWLCSRLNFEFDWQIKLWLKMEDECEKAFKKKQTKPKPPKKAKRRAK